ALAVMSPLGAAVAAVVFVSTVLVSRYVSLGSVLSVVVAMVTLPILVATGLVEPWEYLIYTGIGGSVILWRHWGNLQRLVRGTERRIGQGVDQETQDKPPSRRKP
ncbi:glycerol-3-phosphate acyltransferase, partial [Chloroflexota bacterium]